MLQNKIIVFISLLLSLFFVESNIGQSSNLQQLNINNNWRDRQPDLQILAQHPMGTVKYITVHQTETPVPDSVSETQRLRNTQYGHQVADKRWGDIAYHYLIGNSGTIYQGRSTDYAAASSTIYLTQPQWQSAGQSPAGKALARHQQTFAPGDIAGHITVSFIGTYHNKLPSQAALQASTGLIAALLKEHSLTTSDVFFHREIVDRKTATDCPGNALYKWFRGKPTRGAIGEGLQLVQIK
jgi:hypothetical protein